VSPGLALFLLVLFVLVALAGASFFRHTLAVLLVFLALPLGLVLKAAFGTGVSVFAICESANPSISAGEIGIGSLAHRRLKLPRLFVG